MNTNNSIAYLIKKELRMWTMCFFQTCHFIQELPVNLRKICLQVRVKIITK